MMKEVKKQKITKKEKKCEKENNKKKIKNCDEISKLIKAFPKLRKRLKPEEVNKK